MAVGKTALTFYQGESIKPRFTVTDTNVTDISSWGITFVIKVDAAAADPPLHSASAVIVGTSPTLVFDVSTNLPLSLIPGTYIYSVRRNDAGFDWQLAQAPITIVDSAHRQVP